MSPVYPLSPYQTHSGWESTLGPKKNVNVTVQDGNLTWGVPAVKCMVLTTRLRELVSIVVVCRQSCSTMASITAKEAAAATDNWAKGL